MGKIRSDGRKGEGKRIKEKREGKGKEENKRGKKKRGEERNEDHRTEQNIIIIINHRLKCMQGIFNPTRITCLLP